LYKNSFFEVLEKRFKSPIPQSIVIGLEGFLSNDVQYRRGLRDTAEIIWYDFKEQALDLIHDMENGETWIISREQLTQIILFPGKSPRTDGLIDEVVDGAWYKKTYEECKAIPGDVFYYSWCYSLL